jgi:hypothetical protein
MSSYKKRTTLRSLMLAASGLILTVPFLVSAATPIEFLTAISERLQTIVSELSRRAYVAQVVSAPVIQINNNQWVPNVDGNGNVRDTDFSQLPLNTWVYVKTNTISEVIGSVGYPTKLGNTDGRNSIVTAWSGAGWDWINEVMYVSGGGHADSHLAENGIYGFNTKKMRWEVAIPRTAMSLAMKQNMTNKVYEIITDPYDPRQESSNSPMADGHVGATHTFDTIDYVPASLMNNSRGGIVMFAESVHVYDLDTQKSETAYHDSTQPTPVDLSYKITFMDGWKLFHPRASWYYRYWDLSPDTRSNTEWSAHVGGGATSRGKFVSSFSAGVNFVYNHKSLAKIPQRREVVNFSNTHKIRVRYGDAVDAGVPNDWANFTDKITLTSTDGSHLDFDQAGIYSDASGGNAMYAAGFAYDALCECLWFVTNNIGGKTYKITGLDGNTWRTERIMGAENLTRSINGTFGRLQVSNRGDVSTLVRVTSVPGYVEVMRVQGDTTPMPIVSLTASPATITEGGTTSIAWSTQQTVSCTASWTGGSIVPLSGSYNSGPLLEDVVYTITCTGPTGESVTKDVTVRVSPSQVAEPTLVFTANPSVVMSGDSAVLSWTSGDADACVAQGAWTTVREIAATVQVVPATTTTYTLSCFGKGGTTTKNTIVTVNSLGSPIPLPAATSSVVQFLTHDGDTLGNVLNSSAPTRLHWNNVLGFQWRRGSWGDWLDANQQQFGTSTTGAVPYASFAVPTPGRYTADVTNLVSRWVTNGENRGFYLRMKNNSFPVKFAGRTDSDSMRRPYLTIETSTGTHTLLARANATWNTSTYQVVSSSDSWVLSGGSPTIIHFDLTGVGREIQSATLTVTDVSHDTGSTMANGIVNIFEADPPRFVVPNAETVSNPVLGIANTTENFQEIADHPNVIFSDDFATPGPFDTGWDRPVTREIDQLTNTTYARGSFTAGINGSANKKILAMQGSGGYGGQGMTTQYDELYSQYNLYLESDYGSTIDGIKIPAIGTQFGWWNTTGSGYWAPVTGNGGYPGTGLKVWNATQNRWEYHGHSVRLLTGMKAADNSAYANLFGLSVYPYNLDQGGPFPTPVSFPYVAIQKERWYSFDLYMKLNSMAGARDSAGNYATANPDGEYRVWINGYPAFAKNDYRWRKHPEFGVEGFWLDFYHGGVSPAPYSMHYRVNRVTLATSYIGPMGEYNDVPDAPSPAPVFTFTANPSSIVTDETTTLSWSTVHASTCSATGGWSGTKGTSGTQTVAPTANTTYTLTCTGPGGTVVQHTTVTVSKITPSPTPTTTPALNFVANPTMITSGGSASLSWSTVHASTCSATGGWSGTKGTSGTQTVAPTANTTYTLTCTGPGGTVVQSMTITVGGMTSPAPTPEPTLAFSSNVTSLTRGESATLTWSSQSTANCVAGGGWSGNKALEGSEVIFPTETTTYALLCTGTTSPGVEQQVSIIVKSGTSGGGGGGGSTKQAPLISLKANPMTVTSGQHTTLVWSAEEASSCKASWVGKSNGKVATKGTYTTPSLNESMSYSLTCEGSGGKKTNMVTVGVNKYVLVAQSTQSPIINDSLAGSFRFLRDLGLGDVGEDVRRLQEFLNSQGFLVATMYEGSPGQETTRFGPGTAAALKRFQERYATEILIPNGFVSGTGQFGPATRKKVEALVNTQGAPQSTIQAQITLLLEQIRLLQAELEKLR